MGCGSSKSQDLSHEKSAKCSGVKEGDESSIDLKGKFILSNDQTKDDPGQNEVHNTKSTPSEVIPDHSSSAPKTSPQNPSSPSQPTPQDKTPPFKPSRPTEDTKTIKMDCQAVSETVKTEAKGDSQKKSEDVKSLEPAYVSQILKGSLEAQCPSVAKIVRIFVSSTFTDTRHERNWLMEKVYPKLKNLCQSKGYEYQVVDMRWGIRDEAQDDHMTTDICLKEVELCKQQSTGPFFMSLMSHKYGYRDFPREIKADEFEVLMKGVTDEEAKGLLLRWFQRDNNTIPPTYVLQPKSVYLPNIKSNVAELRQTASQEWDVKNNIMHSALTESAMKNLDPSRSNVYRRSVSEVEVRNGLKEQGPNDRFVWFHRLISDIDKVDPEKEKDILRKYRDLSTDSLKDDESKRLLQDLEEKTMKSNLPESNIFEYHVQWESHKGLDPDSNANHKEYLNKFCHDVEQFLTSELEKAFNENDQFTSENPLFYEILQHTVFCKEKCKAFHGRETTLKKIEDYLKDSSRQPFVIHGQSGCGKTSILAMAGKLAQKIHGDKAVTVIRFIGTTPDSSNVASLLISIINQLKSVLGQETRDLSALNAKQLSLVFIETMKRVAKLGPLVVLLDSLDQLDPGNDARQLAWLPSLLSTNIKLIVSTLPEEQYEAFPALKAQFKGADVFLDVPELEESDITGILEKWLEAAGRTLTQAQRLCVLSAFKTCPLPLFLKLSFDEACKWKSYSPPEMTVLQSTVRDCINNLFASMEIFHGRIFVSKALGYLTASHSGLSEAELEDILSCDEDVLGDVYRFWTPPIRRLPPLLLVRMKRDLKQYVVDRGSDGRQVFYWYHRQFIEAATDRYCSDQNQLRQLHTGLANFFAGTWGEGNSKPYVDKNGQQHMADRHVSKQPIKFGDTFNIRKLNNLPFHRVKAGQLEEVKSECLLNYDFLISKIETGGLRSVLDDFHEARQAFPDDFALEGISEALQLSQNAIVYDIRTFPSQMYGRIRNNKILSLPEVSNFMAHCQQANHMYLEPDRPILEPSGGQLVHSIADHSENITALVLNAEGTIAVSYQENGILKMYDVTSGKVIRTVKGLGKEADTLRLANNDGTVVANTKGKLSAYDIPSGTKRWSTPYKNDTSTFVIGGPGYSLILTLTEKTYTFLSADTGQLLGDVQNLPDEIPDSISFGSYNPAVGNEHYMVTVESDQKVVFVFSPHTKSLSHYKKVLKSYKNEENEKVDATVDGLQISHDGKFLYMANYSDNNIHFVKTENLETVKTFPGCKSDFSEKFHLSKDGKYLFFSNTSYVRVWDLGDGKKATILQGANISGIEDVASVDMNTFVTINSDRTVKIWDLSRGDNPGMRFEELSPSHKTKVPNLALSTFARLDSPRYFLQVWVDQEKDKGTQCFGIFDTSLKKFVTIGTRCFENSEDKLTSIAYLDDWTVAFDYKSKIKLLDLRTMKVTGVVQGKVPAYNSDVLSVSGGKELAHLSKGRMNLVIADRKTGKTVSIIKSGQKNRIDVITTNKTGTVVAAECEGPLLIFDPIKRTYEFEITPKMVNLPSSTDLYLNDSIITPDGNYILFLSDYKIPKSKLIPGVKSEDVTSVFVFSLSKRTLEHVLIDVVAYNFLKRFKTSEKEVYVDSMELIDDKQLVTSHDDHKLRIWDFAKGTLLHCLTGHISYTLLSAIKDSNILLTNGSWDEENGIRLWDTNTWKCFAVYRYEGDVKNIQMIGPNSSSVICQIKGNRDPVIFTLKGQGSEELKSKTVPESSFPAIFDSKGEVQIDISHPDDGTTDNDDPDDDEEEKEDNDDDDDDDIEDSDEEISDEESWMNKN